ncbi:MULTISPECIES: iron reductase [Streptosporangium]|uniref:Uncharacterized protein n=1 Tax=Streptosporangium brasiliense TaxID=47480 RepID=A0ABT9RJH5_9ACTN|nr:iron reductase [Streptosporangium brasiliense]MDP9868864.1 hypothetical protein [Streptosporangium brasiliense]
MTLSALRKGAEFGSFFTIDIGANGTGWHSVNSDYARGFTDPVEATATQYGTGELRIGASIAQLGHAARLWSPLLAAVLGHGVVPDLRRLERADDGPRLCLPTASGWHTGPEDQVMDLIYDMVVRGHLEPLAAGLRVKVAPGLLYGNAASALAEAGRAIVAARPGLAAPATRLVTDLLGRGALTGKGAVTSPDLAFRRTTCRLYYRVLDEAKCDD